jgi:hypothetical protein
MRTIVPSQQHTSFLLLVGVSLVGGLASFRAEYPVHATMRTQTTLELIPEKKTLTACRGGHCP